jgi:ubiquitin-conjugating enzyme E2 D/E
MNKTLKKRIEHATRKSDNRWVINEISANNYIVIIMPHKGCPYEEGIFFLNMLFPIEYPFKPPILTMNTKIYHPNISQDIGHIGKIYIDMLYDNWTPYCTLTKILEHIYNLFENPDMSNLSTCNIEATNMYKSNPEQFKEIAQKWTEKYAIF